MPIATPPPHDFVWVLLCAGLVMLMQGGFCFLESGLSRAKNSINVAIKNLLDFCVAGLVFFLIGFNVMFGDADGGLFGRPGPLFDSTTSSWTMTFFLFQLVFCGTATTIVSGAVAERLRFGWYLVISVLVSAVIYPVFGHWAWGGTGGFGSIGWLAQLGFVDFAGSTVVHSVGGWVALAVILVLGPRIGRFATQGPAMHGHNLPMATIGVMILWFGWFGFNGGSTLGMNDRVPLILVNTNLGACAGGITALILAWVSLGRPDVVHAITGVVAGLVSITACCHVIDPIAAVFVGAGGASLCFLACLLLERLHIDDVVGAWPAHTVGGIWGTLSVALFGHPDLIGTNLGYWEQLRVQGIGISVCGMFAFGGVFVILWVVNRFVPLRVTAAEEKLGLNIVEHGATTEILDLLADMERHRAEGDFHRAVAVEPHTEVGQIAAEYNRVLTRVDEEIHHHTEIAEQLRQAEQRYRRIFEEAIEGIFQTTPDGRYLIANPALARIYGYDSSEQLIHEVTDISTQLYVDPNRRDEFRLIMERSGMVTGFESEIRRRDDSTAWIRENARAVRDDEGTLVYYEGTVEDITERKRTLEMQREIRVAQEANRTKSEFLAHMSHEIRTPLNGVMGMIELLSRSTLDNRQRHYVDVARSSSGLLLSLINQVLDFSKIESGKLELDPHEFDLWTLVEETADSFASQVHSKGLALRTHISPDIPRHLIGDSQRLRQVMTNLIGNAIKFTSQGHVDLRLAPEKRADRSMMIRFSVTDTGIGIPPDRIDRLFQPFTQMDASTTRRFGGTGLGLAIAKQLAEVMGGQMGVESQEGIGSEFWWTANFGVPVDAGDVSTMLRSLRVLVAHPSDDVAAEIRDALSTWGVDTEIAADADASLGKFRLAARGQRPFGLAMVDRDLRAGDRTLAEAIRSTSEGCEVPIVLVADAGSNTNEAISVPDAVDLVQPIRHSKLFDAVMGAVVRNPSAARSSATPENAVRAIPKDLRILVAEDNEVNQFVTREILASEGLSCDVVATGREAVDAIQQQDYDVVLMDCQMPEMDGFAAATEVRRLLKEKGPKAPSLPIIALTASAIRGDRERCLDAGMNDYVTKPIDPHELFAAIERVLNGGRAGSNFSAAKIQSSVRMGSGSSESPPYDIASLRDRHGGDPTFLARLFEKWEKRLIEDLEAVEKGAEGGDIEELKRRGHTLKGAAATMSATALAEAARSLEALPPKSTQEELNAAAKRVVREISRAAGAISDVFQGLDIRPNRIRDWEAVK